jgi:hypothetical protein
LIECANQGELTDEACFAYGGLQRRMQAWVSLMKRDHFENHRINRKIILRWVLRN